MNPILWSSLEGGDEIHDSLVAFVEKEHIHLWNDSGHWHRPGSTLGFFHPDRKEYRERNFTASRKSFPSQELSICFRKSPMDILISPLAGKWQYIGQPYGLGRHRNYRQNHRHLF